MSLDDDTMRRLRGPRVAVGPRRGLPEGTRVHASDGTTYVVRPDGAWVCEQRGRQPGSGKARRRAAIKARRAAKQP